MAESEEGMNSLPESGQNDPKYKTLLTTIDTLLKEIANLNKGEKRKLTIPDTTRLHEIVQDIQQAGLDLALENRYLSGLNANHSANTGADGQKISYAQAASTQVPNWRQININKEKQTKWTPRQIITITPNDTNKESKETRKDIERIVKPIQKRLKINKTRNIKNGGVLIETENEAHLNIFLQSKELENAGYKIEKPKKRGPRLILYDVNRIMTQESIKECLFEQNLEGEIDRDTYNTCTKILFKTGPRNGDTVHWVIETNGKIRWILNQKNKIYMDWQCCKVADFTVVTRCNKCLAYGHAEKFCKAEQQICSGCHEPGHTSRNCNAPKKETCYNCTKIRKTGEHKTEDKSCPVYVGALERLISQTDYSI